MAQMVITSMMLSHATESFSRIVSIQVGIQGLVLSMQRINEFLRSDESQRGVIK